MNLWESCHDRLHSASDQPPWPQPPGAPGWTSAEALFDASADFDLDDAISDPIDRREDASVDQRATIAETDYSEANRAQAKEAIAAFGIEAVAFYAPIHVYVRETTALFTAAQVGLGNLAVRADRARLSQHLLVATERVVAARALPAEPFIAVEFAEDP